MIIDETNATEYLCRQGLVSHGSRPAISVLAGGVSNFVLRVERTEGPPLVLKQARRQLRVPDPWFCSELRLHREIDTLRAYRELLATQNTRFALPIEIPQIVLEDRENYAYVMSAAAADHTVWKDDLLASRLDSDVATTVGALLGSAHAASWQCSRLESAFADQQFFRDLRLDPYYMEVARQRPHLAPALNGLVAELDQNRCALVHGDFSPKNI